LPDIKTSISRATAELQFETAVVTRLDDLLFKVANDAASRRGVWGERAEEDRSAEDRSQVASQALANMLTVALVAVDRLPGFEKNKDAWYDYTETMLKRSPGVVEEILAHPKWWPAAVLFAENVSGRQAAQEPPAADGKTPPPRAHDS
jgi:hypothetical protein